jgi:hypothetical protein
MRSTHFSRSRATASGRESARALNAMSVARGKEEKRKREEEAERWIAEVRARKRGVSP